MTERTNALQLNDFKLFPGEKLYVSYQGEKALFTLCGFAPDNGLFALPKDAAFLAKVKRSDLFDVKMVSGNFALTFKVKALAIHQTPFQHVVLSWPQHVAAKQLRAHARIPVELSVAIDPEDDTADQFTLHGVCSNLSLSGAAVQLSGPVGKVGDAFYLTMRAKVASQDHVLLLPARLKNMQQLESTPIPVYRHGFLFTGVDEDSELVLTAFIYQQFLVETGYINVV